MARALTVRELIKALKKLNQDAIPVICREGKDHHNFITEDDIIEDVDPYFSGLEPENIEYNDDEDGFVNTFVQIASI
jgi:hypothetical protein